MDNTLHVFELIKSLQHFCSKFDEAQYCIKNLISYTVKPPPTVASLRRDYAMVPAK